MGEYELKYSVLPPGYSEGTFQFDGEVVTVKIRANGQGLDSRILDGKEIPQELKERFPESSITLESFRKLGG